MGSFFLELTLSRLEAPLEDVALAAGTSIDAAAARGATHIAISGSDKAVTVFLTSKPTVVRIPIPKSEIRHVSGDTFEMKDSSRLLVTSERMGVSVLGTVCTSMSGQASSFLDDILVNSSKGSPPVGAIGLQYSNWSDYSAVLGIRNPEVFHDQETRVCVNFVHDDDTKQTDASKELEMIFQESWDLRQAVVYAPAPTLTKSVMRTPVGINGSTYDLASVVVGKPFSHSTETLDDILRSAILSELGGNTDDMINFLSDKPTSVDHAQWAGVVASALSTAAATMIPYRADGRTAVLPGNVLKHFDSESWMAEPIRPFGADDCDGSAAWITSAVTHIKNIMANDANAKSKYEVLHAVYKTLAHYKVGIAVLGAHVASADAVGGATDTILGHAMVLVIPKIHLLDALHRGTGCAPNHVVDKDQRDLLAELRFRAEYPYSEATANLQFSLNDIRALSQDYAMSDPILAHLRALPGLAAEGTGAASSTLWTKDDAVRKQKIRTAARVDAVLSKMSPSQMIPIKDLDTGPDGHHKFYSEFVEVLFPVDDLKDVPLAKQGMATSQYVLCQQSTNLAKAGVTPEQIATGNYTAIPLWKANLERALLMIDSAAHSRRHTLPPSNSPDLDERQVDALEASRSVLIDLHNHLSSQIAQDDADEVRFTFTFASLVNNPSGVANVVDLAKNVDRASGIVDFTPVRGLAVSKGKDVGVSVVVTMLVPH